MRIFTATVFLHSPQAEWTGEISFPAPIGNQDWWERIYEVIHAVQSKACEFPVGSNVEMGLYLEIEDVNLRNKAQIGFWDLMQNCKTPTSIRWRKPARLVPGKDMCHETQTIDP